MMRDAATAARGQRSAIQQSVAAAQRQRFCADCAASRAEEAERQRAALQSRRRCRDRPLSVRTEPGVLSGPQRGRPRRRDHSGRPRRRRRRNCQRRLSARLYPHHGQIRRAVRAPACRQAGGGEGKVGDAAQRVRALCRLHAGPDFQSTACNAIHSIEQRTAKWIISAMERTDGDNVVPLTHEQLATLLGVGRSYTSRVIQTFKAEGFWRPGAVRSWCATRKRCGCGPASATNPSKTIRGSVARGLSDRGGSQSAEAGTDLTRKSANQIANNPLFSGDF